MAYPSENRLHPLCRLGRHTVPHAGETQTDNSRSWTPPIRRHTRLLVIIPSQRSLSRHRRVLRTGSDEPSHTACWSNSTSSCPVLAEEEFYGRLSTSKLASFNCILNRPQQRQGRPVARYVKPASSHSFLVRRFLVSKRTGLAFILAFTSERSTCRNSAWFVAITTASAALTDSSIDPADG